MDPFAFIVIIFSQETGYWNVDSIQMPTSATFYEIAIGKGRNDDTFRLYSAHLGILLEYTYLDSIWRVDTCATDVYLSCIGFGDLRNDGIQRIYGAGGYWIYEFTYTNGAWQCESIGFIDDPTIDFVYCLAIGSGRNDDTSRIYLGHWNHMIYELSYRDTCWVLDSIPPPGSMVTDIVIGDGRNDGVNRLYVNAATNSLYEISYTPSGWQTVSFGSSTEDYNGIALGTGRNDGVNRIYSWNWMPPPSNGYFLIEFTGPFWTSQIIGTGIGGFGGKLYLGRAKNDTLFRVYGMTNDNVYEFEYIGGWHRSHLDSGRIFNMAIVIGKGRNDDVNRIYVGNGNGYIYEYTWIPTGIEESIGQIGKKIIGVEVFPNPFINQCIVKFEIQNLRLPTLKIYDVTGRQVCDFSRLIVNSKCSMVLWDGRDDSGRRAPAGVYFVDLKAVGNEKIEKVILLR